jgi:hypothetical protein
MDRGELGMILITGCARSRTSMTTSMLQACGAHLGRPKDVNDLYENTAIRQGILKPMIREFGGDPLGQTHFPAPNAVKPVEGLKSRVLDALGEGSGPPAYKDAKIALVWQSWAIAFPAAKWVLVRRSRDGIIDSCIRTHFMRAHGEDRDGWGAWVDAQIERFDAMKAAGLDLIEIDTDELVRNPEALLPVANHCGLEFDRAAVAACIKPRN